LEGNDLKEVFKPGFGRIKCVIWKFGLRWDWPLKLKFHSFGEPNFRQKILGEPKNSILFWKEIFYLGLSALKKRGISFKPLNLGTKVFGEFGISLNLRVNFMGWARI